MSVNEGGKTIWPKKRLVSNNVTEDGIHRDTIHSSKSTVGKGTTNVHSSAEISSDMEKKENEVDQNNSLGTIDTLKNNQRSVFYIPRRYIITFMLGFGMLLIYSMRTNVGVTVVMILDEAPHEKIGPAHLIEKVCTSVHSLTSCKSPCKVF